MELGLSSFGDVTAIDRAGERLRELVAEAELADRLGLDVFGVGEHHRAAEHAEIAWPLLARVHSQTDSYSLRMATAISPLPE